MLMTSLNKLIANPKTFYTIVFSKLKPKYNGKR